MASWKRQKKAHLGWTEEERHTEARIHSHLLYGVEVGCG